MVWKYAVKKKFKKNYGELGLGQKNIKIQSLLHTKKLAFSINHHGS